MISPEQLAALVNAKDETIDCLKSEVVNLRKVIGTLTGDGYYDPMNKKKPEIKYPPIWDEKENKHRPMKQDEKDDYTGTLNEVLGTSISAG